jgi:diacylglycerol kinase family enzyme
VTTVRTARLAITALDGTLPAHCDGEIISVDGTRLEVELLPHQIEVVCPKELNA